ncbi:MAG: hypothetical protein Q4A05_01645 [Ruminococcus sp.]|nr:hypothetical protein [Ruminococcus sp.]
MEKKHQNPLIIAAKAVMLALTAVYPLFMVCMSGAGLVYNSDSYGSELAAVGVFLIISGLVTALGAVLCLSRRNLPNIVSVVCSVGGPVLCLAMMYRLCAHADAAGWTDKFAMTPISDMYRARIMPTIAPAAIAVVVAVIQLFSYEAAEERRKRRARRLERENAPAPKIIDD